MPRTRIDIKGIMTDLPQENLPQGACQEMINMRYIDNAWRPVGTKKVDWEHVDNILGYYKHTVDGVTVDIVHTGGSILHRYYGTSWSFVSIFGFADGIISTSRFSFASFNRYLIASDYVNGRMYIAKMVPNGTASTYTDKRVWDFNLPKLVFYGVTGYINVRYLSVLEDIKEATKGAYLDLQDSAAKSGAITSMVYVRYALKMFDGSYIMHSPIYFVARNDVATYPNTILSCGKDITSNAYLTTNEKYNEFDIDDKVSYKFKVSVYKSRVVYKVPLTIGKDVIDNSAIVDTLKTFKDFIVSLDIFISDQVEIFDIENLPTSKSAGVAEPFSLNSKTNTDLISEVTGFYLYHSIPIDELVCDDTVYTNLTSPNNRTVLSVNTTDKHDYAFTDIRNVETLEPLPFQDNAHFNTAKISRIYNNRLMLGNVTERLFNGYSSLLLCSAGDTGTTSYAISAYVYLETKDGERIVQSLSSQNFYAAEAPFYINTYLIYPDIRATKIRIYSNSGGGRYVEYTMKAHPYLDFSYAVTSETRSYVDKVALTASTMGTAGTPPTTSYLVQDENRLMISRVNNPFVYSAEETNNIGSSDILNIASNSKQMSEGQFGRHPIIVFTKSGIYAIEIGEGGVYSRSVIPITSDECTGAALHFYSKTMQGDTTIYLSPTGVKVLNGNVPVDITQFVKNNMPSVLNQGYNLLGEYAIPPTEKNIKDVVLLTANYSTFVTGDYIYWSGSNWLLLPDKSYYFYTNFDNYLVPKVYESVDWDNDADYSPVEGEFL